MTEPSSEAAVLEANRLFYRAFADGDLPLMQRVWASTELIACVHPGWRALHGHAEVMASWRAILAEGPSRIEHADARALVSGESAIVTCLEQLPGGELVATNVFVREGGSWRMVHHHASPFRRQRVPGTEPDTRSIN